MIVFDVTDKRSYEDIKKYWLEQVLNNCDAPVELMLVANKTDLRNERVITPEQAKTDLMNFLNSSEIRHSQDKYRPDPKECILGQQYCEVSAKNVDSVDEVFKQFLSKIVSN